VRYNTQGGQRRLNAGPLGGYLMSERLLYTANIRAEAEMLQHALEADGIPSYLRGEGSPGTASVSVRTMFSSVYVSSEDFEDALEIARRIGLTAAVDEPRTSQSSLVPTLVFAAIAAFLLLMAGWNMIRGFYRG
jgi:hypothetical protein